MHTWEVQSLAWLIPTISALVLLYVTSAYKTLWWMRSQIGKIASGLLLASLPFIFTTGLMFVTQLFLSILQLWLILFGLRLVMGRLPEEFLRSSTKRGSLLAGLGLVLGIASNLLIGQIDIILLLVSLSMVIAIAFLTQLVWTFKHYRLRKLSNDLKLHNLPTVTLAIPARNETHALSQCLKAAIESDYPKLEILVADDCSQDKTPELIRSFAHDGVRFIQGEVPAEGWLGKNQACQTLAEQALGDYIIFAGVDTHLDPHSITQLINYALSNQVSMVSVLPSSRASLSLGTLLPQLRYFWQIVLPITRRRVPVASSCWMIKTDVLRQQGGFESVRQKIVPEGSFARHLFSEGQYRFVISNDELSITTAKKWSSQNETALRLLYPTFKRQPMFILIAGLLLICLLLMPFVLLIGGLIAWQFGLVFWLSLISSGLSILSYALVIWRTHPNTRLSTCVTYPLSLVQELILLVVSMFLYEFGDVNWKGRNVCYPVIWQSHLPQMAPSKTRYR